MAIQKLLMCRILSLKGAEKAPDTETQSISFEADTVQIAGEKTAVSYQPKQSDKPNQGAKTTHAKTKIQIIPSNNPKNQSKAGKKNCKVSLETVGRDGEGRRAQQHEQNRGISVHCGSSTANLWFVSVPLWQFLSRKKVSVC